MRVREPGQDVSILILSAGDAINGLGRLVLGLAGAGAEPARIALRGVRRVEVAQYRISGDVSTAHLRTPERLRSYLDRRGWTKLAAFRDGDEAVWVLYRSRGDRITDLFVTALSGQELVLARLSGDLGAIVLDVLAHHRARVPLLGSEACERQDPSPAPDLPASDAPDPEAREEARSARGAWPPGSYGAGRGGALDDPRVHLPVP